MTNLPSNPKPQYNKEKIRNIKKSLSKHDEREVIKKMLEIVEKNNELTKQINNAQ